MGFSSHQHIFFLAGVYSIFFNNLSAEGNNQPPSNSTIEENGKMACEGSSFFCYYKADYPRDCSEARDPCSSSVWSGVHLVKPDGYEEPFEAYCDNHMDSGGWTVILRRSDGSVSFNRNWSDYKKGFGFLSTEFWLGSSKLSYLTNQAVYELHIDIMFENGTTCDVKYDEFRISDEWSNYTISTVGIYQNDSACRWSEWDNPDNCSQTDLSTSFTDCNDVYNAGNRQDGVYCIRPTAWIKPPFKAFCNMPVDGGSWTVFQRRVDGTTDFYRSWDEYKEGFGDMEHEFWLGNEKLHYITQQATYEYCVDFVLSSLWYYNKYSNFHVDNEDQKYRLTNVGTGTGTRGHSLRSIQNTPFSTHDEDNDGRIYDCAEGHRSGWWHGAFFYTGYNHCHYFVSGGTRVLCSHANPNGEYDGGTGDNVFDESDYYNRYNSCNHKYTELKIRRVM